LALLWWNACGEVSSGELPLTSNLSALKKGSPRGAFFSLPQVIGLALVLVSAAALYLPVVDYLYIWDDRFLFVDNPALRSADGFVQAILTPILPGSTYFRPAVLASFGLQFYLFGADPAASHLGNLAIHLTTALLVVVLTRRLLARMGRKFDGWVPVIAAAVYALHPSLIEPVAWASGRFDLMATLFSVAALITALGSARYKIFTSSAFFLLALLSKEVAAVIPAVLVLSLVVFSDRTEFSLSARLRAVMSERLLLLAWALVFILYLTVRWLLMPSVLHVASDLNQQLSVLGIRVAYIGQAIFFYARKSLVPFFGLSPHYPLLPEDMTPTDIFVGLATVFFALILALRSISRSIGLGGWALACWLIALLPVAHIIPLTIGGSIGHDRFLALPLVFFSVGVATIPLDKFRSAYSQSTASFSRIVGILVGAWLLFCAFTVHTVLPMWRNDLTLWSWAYEQAPDSKLVRGQLMMASVTFGRPDLALDVINKEFSEIGDKGPMLHLAKAHALLRLRDFEAAERSALHVLAPLLRAHRDRARLRLDPLPLASSGINDMYLAYGFNLLADIFIARRDFQGALEAAEIALIYRPGRPSTLLTKTFALWGLDRSEEGNETYELAMKSYIPTGQAQARILREEFMRQLCTRSTASSSNPRMCTAR
jgi:hypothetical protein